VDDVLRAQPDEEERRCGFVHLYGVRFGPTHKDAARLDHLRRELGIAL
jgi:hypothetical protein